MPDYAVIALGGKQYRVTEGQTLLVDRLKVEEGESFSPEALMVGDSDSASISDGGTVKAEVVEHLRGKKIRVFNYKPKSQIRRTKGHRSELSRIRIASIGS